jgi:hypothetical protein
LQQIVESLMDQLLRFRMPVAGLSNEQPILRDISDTKIARREA